MQRIFCKDCNKPFWGKFDPNKCPECGGTNFINIAKSQSNNNDREEECWKLGTGYGDCAICIHSYECSGSREED